LNVLSSPSVGDFEDLKRIVAAGKALVVVGAGVSIAATKRAPCASWKGLLEDGAQRAQKRDSIYRKFRHPIVVEQIKSGDVENMLSAADMIEQALGGPRGGDFAAWLRGSVGALVRRENEVLDALVALQAPIATTNYDRLLEEATGLPALTWQDPAVVDFPRGDCKAVLHLHGHVDESSSVVLGRVSYDRLTRDEKATDIVRALRLSRTLLFVGCGAGLEDPHFHLLRQWMARMVKDSPEPAYRLALESEVDQLQYGHAKDERIIVVPFGDKNECLGPFLRRLAPTEAAASTVGPSAAEAVSASKIVRALSAHLPGEETAPERIVEQDPLPRKCGYFLHRQVMDQIIQRLCSPAGFGVSLSGAHGIGKTTLATHVCHHLRAQQSFKHIFWITERASLGRYSAPNLPALLTLAEVVDAMLTILDQRTEVAGVYAVRLRRLSQRLHQAGKCLIVLDNVPLHHDTSSRELMALLQQMPDGTKVLLTARPRHPFPDIVNTDVGALSNLESKDLIERYCKYHGLPSPLAPELDRILACAKGNPIAIIRLLTIGAHGTLVLGEALAAQARPLLRNTGSPDHDSLKDLLEVEYRALAPPAREALNILSILGTALSESVILGLSGIGAEEWRSAHTALSRWNFVSTDSDNRLSVDPLVREYLRELFMRGSRWPAIGYELAERYVKTLRKEGLLAVDSVIAFTAGLEPRKLSADNTVMDFAFNLHTALGLRISAAQAAGQEVPLNRVLRDGDVLTFSQSRKPTVTREWLNWVRSERARRAIEAYLTQSSEFLEAMRAGKHRARHGDPAVAIESLEIATKLRPSSSWAWNRLGNAYRVFGRKRESVDAHRKARVAQPHNRSALTGLGNCEFLSKRFDEAAELFRQSCAAKDGNANALFGLARCLLAQGQYKDAVDNFEACMRAATTKEREASACVYRAIAQAGLLTREQQGARTSSMTAPKRGDLEEEISAGFIEGLALFEALPLLGPVSVCHKALAIACSGTGDPVSAITRLRRLGSMGGIISGLRIDIDSIGESVRKCLDGIQSLSANNEQPSTALVRLQEWLDRSFSNSLA
jgi:tetratricopeptide (TPR) repeat protein